MKSKILSVLVLILNSLIVIHSAQASENVYMQTNELNNQVVHFKSDARGLLHESSRISTRGKGTGGYKPVTGEKDAPNDFESVSSVILSDNHQFLFITNGGDNSVTSFKVKYDGELSWVDTQFTGQAVNGHSGTANSLAYDSSRHILYVSHIFGPDHIHYFSVAADGKLTRRPGQYSVNTTNLTDRLPTQILLTPDKRFLIANILFDKRPSLNADGSANLVIANSTEKNGMAVFKVGAGGSLSKPIFQDGGGQSPFFTQFLNGSKDSFIELFAVSDGAMLGHIDNQGKITTSSVVPINNSAGKPSEICWASITPDNKHIFTADLAYSQVSSFGLLNGKLRIERDPAAPAVPGDGTFVAIDGKATSSPVDNWISPDGKYFYQIYPNASKLVSYTIGTNGNLKVIGTTAVPRNTSQGLAGF